MSSNSLGKTIVTGGAGFLGSAVCARLAAAGVEHAVPRKAHYDLTCPTATSALYRSYKPETVIHLAAEVGGIGANRENPGRYAYANLAMGVNVIEQARAHGVRKVVFVGTVCSYPLSPPVPFSESSIWDGYPEATNAAYGIAKKTVGEMLMGYHRQYGLAGAYVIPTNLYGPRDNFDTASSHVIPALIRKFAEAGDQPVSVWGTGSASREFLYVEDAAEAIVLAAQRIDEPSPINLGGCGEITIKALAEKIAGIVGHTAGIAWDSSKPDGQPRRCVDSTRAKELLGWAARTDFDAGLRRTVEWWRASSTASVRK
jgi:GDP-L-fucose synthase